MIRPTLMRASRFAGDRRGAAAIEFAFIAPILIVFYMGMTEICQMLMAKRRVDHVSAAMADLVAQAATVTPTDLTDIKNISATVLAPFPNASLNVRITSIKDDVSGAPKVAWSWPAGGPAKETAPPFTVATPLSPGESVIVTETSYTYNSGVGYLITSAQTMTHKAELRPRKNDEVACPTC